MFGFGKARAEKKARDAEVQSLIAAAVEETDDAFDEYFAKVEQVSQEFLKRLDGFLTDLEPVEGETPREVSEMWLLDVVDMWREARPEMEARGREFLQGQFEVGKEIGIEWSIEEIFKERFDRAEFNFKARAVIAAGEAADRAEGGATTKND